MKNNKKKVLIINGSPHKNGDTSYILKEIKGKINGEIEEVFAYFDNIKPCIDCRYCWKNEGCAIKDKMEIIYKDDYDVIIIASPVYMYNVTPPLFSIITRLNMIWSNEYFLNKPYKFKQKQGFLVLTGGGTGEPKHAIEMAQLLFQFLNAKFDIYKDYIYSLNTNNVPACEDKNLRKMIEEKLKDIDN